jgi:hypothetical protein
MSGSHAGVSQRTLAHHFSGELSLTRGGWCRPLTKTGGVGVPRLVLQVLFVACALPALAGCINAVECRLNDSQVSDPKFRQCVEAVRSRAPPGSTGQTVSVTVSGTDDTYFDNSEYGDDPRYWIGRHAVPLAVINFPKCIEPRKSPSLLVFFIAGRSWLESTPWPVCSGPTAMVAEDDAIDRSFASIFGCDMGSRTCVDGNRIVVSAGSREGGLKSIAISTWDNNNSLQQAELVRYGPDRMSLSLPLSSISAHETYHGFFCKHRHSDVCNHAKVDVTVYIVDRRATNIAFSFEGREACGLPSTLTHPDSVHDVTEGNEKSLLSRGPSSSDAAERIRAVYKRIWQLLSGEPVDTGSSSECVRHPLDITNLELEHGQEECKR